MRDQIKIEADIARTLDGPCDDGQLMQAAAAVATIDTLIVSAPEGWDASAIDPLDPKGVADLFEVFEGLRKAEDSFRKNARPQRPDVGPRTQRDDPLRVPAPVRPDAN
ncbi:MAG: hypothetical protein GC191_09225 [Azospirillum sp.]|nr:hypothetical protein [Azospirillum sp.]